MKDQIDHTIRRTRRYWSMDGLPEFGFGLICIVLAGYFWVQSSLPADSLLYQVLNILFILIVVGGSLGSNYLVSTLKKKFTYPRTGYVTYRRPSSYRRLILALAAGVISALLVIVIYRTDLKQFWLPLITAVIVAAVFAFLAYQGEAPRYYYLAVVSLAFGAIAVLAGLNDLQGLAVYYGGIGLAQLLSGGIVFRNFLAANNPPEEDLP